MHSKYNIEQFSKEETFQEEIGQKIMHYQAYAEWCAKDQNVLLFVPWCLSFSSDKKSPLR